ncbi:hypothetical protein CRE_20013 [Caenorhabditis remanei]|uniref:Uncharacterized protein n=1 Tax=Caenorhabditis remanei TaxID=31234 RepID=E3NCE7_CAERE|nr:hypothetical protein CRE_20013 [Caenorhabditis remanei]
MEHFREACDNSSESYFDFDDGVFNTSYDETEAGSSTSENFDRRNAIDVISAVFLYNNVSRTFAQDIFTIAELLRDYSSISLSEIYRTIETWSNRENRCYTSCGACQKLLKQSKICTNRECSRYLRTQTNMAGCTRIITFSLKEQLLGILESGNYDKDLLNRDNWTSSLSAKLSRTPKYRDRLEKANREHPGVITMFLTLNMDGFRKRGLARGEFWPLYVAANDLTEERSKFSEYRPEVVMISSLIQTSKQIESGDFNAAFERMRCEVEETQRYPIEVTIDGVPHKIRLEIFQTVLDMDEGLPAPHEKPLSRLQCSVNSLSHTVKAGSSLKLLEHRNLDTRHIINGTDEFQSIDLTKFYMNYRLTGDTPAFQMSSLLVQILKKSTYPRFQIWKYTFYPKSSKSADIHFHKTPEHIVESLKDFCFDVTGCFLPDDFLGDPIDESHWFMEKLPFNDARTEIIRRRKMRQPVLETFTMALWQALRTLRNYHYDLSSRQLLNCTSRGDCTSHLKWEHLKNFREKCRNEGVDQDDYTEQQLHDYAMVSSSSDPRNSSAYRNGSRVQQ